MVDSRSVQLCFDPDLHPDDTLKSFKEFIQMFELRYEATFPDPPKVSMDSTIERWKLAQDNPETKPNLQQYEEIRTKWQSKDKVAKILGIYGTRRLHGDWLAAEPEEAVRKEVEFKTFVEKMQEYYQPTENSTLKNFQFRSLMQDKTESFSAFCNRVEKEAKYCQFKCAHANCTAETTVVRDQIIIGLIQDEIRKDALKNAWDLKNLRVNGMRMESAAKGASAIAGESAVNKLGRYSYRNLKKDKERDNKDRQRKALICYYCGTSVNTNIVKHVEQCPAKTSKCRICGRTGHYSTMCKNKKDINEVSTEEASEEESNIYNVNIFCITEPKNSHTNIRDNFKVQVVVNNSLDTILADTGASISVCGTKDAEKWNLNKRMVNTNIRIKPYNSPVIPVIGVARCAVTFGKRSVPVEWHIIDNRCEPVLSGKKAEQLGIIQFSPQPEVFEPVRMIKQENKEEIQQILQAYPENFKGIGKLKNHQIKLHYDQNVKPVAEPARTIPYHLQDRVTKIIDEMINQDVIEEHPTDEPALWTSNIVIAPKTDGDIRITLDARNVNRAIQASSMPIPKHEDIKAKLAGATIFSKLDLKSAFWQMELKPESRHLTVFHANGTLYRYKRLSMGLKPAQSELNAALSPLFAGIQQAHIIHDDLIIATKSEVEHNKVLKMVMEIISNAGITLNPKKCVFGEKEIEFWGLRISAEGIHPDPAKVDALQYISPPKNKAELLSFLCMMQSNAEFIPNFSCKAAHLRELTKLNVRFNWDRTHEDCYNDLLQSFTKEAMLRYFDLGKGTYIIVDAHITGLGAMLAQGSTLEEAKPVAFASRTTTKAEERYPQIDLEATALDFAMRRFRNYIVGAPDEISIITDHKPLCSIFNGKRKGSVRTERIKLRHQDIRFNVIYQQGNLNQSDYLSRHAKPIEKVPVEEQKEAEDLNNLLYTLHTTPIVDCIGLAEIAKETAEDETLSRLKQYIQDGKTWIPKTDSAKLQKFKKLMPEITVTGNGVLLKGDRIILPEKLHITAIELAHRGAHPKQSGLERRLRYHFFFHDLTEKVVNFVHKCSDCNSYDEKKTTEPIKHHIIPKSSWETTAVDLFGPMPSSNHVVVVYDLASRFPAAKLVTSTKADKVIPVLEEIYDVYGNPQKQISDNGPPFNSIKMTQFADKRNITLQTTPPIHPSSNPAETFMRPLGKAMKIGARNKITEKETLQQMLNSYRQTPHPATGIPPADMMFRYGHQSNFPRKALTDEDIQKGKERDLQAKLKNEEQINSSKYRKKSFFNIGDWVLIRNYHKVSKFDPLFQPDPYVIIDINETGNKIVVEQHNRTLCRHPDDLKPFYGTIQSEPEEKIVMDHVEEMQFHDDDEYEHDNEWPFHEEVPIPIEQYHNLEPVSRRSERDRRQKHVISMRSL